MARWPLCITTDESADMMILIFLFTLLAYSPFDIEKGSQSRPRRLAYFASAKTTAHAKIAVTAADVDGRRRADDAAGDDIDEATCSGFRSMGAYRRRIERRFRRCSF